MSLPSTTATSKRSKTKPGSAWRKTNDQFFEPRHLRVIEPVRRPK